MKKKLLITENQLRTLHEDFNNDPYQQRWHHERFSLKKYLLNFGNVMLSRENGKTYKVIFDKYISDLIGINYCICIQYDTMTNEMGDIIYIRAYDKFKEF